MNREQTKAAHYIQQLDEARCNGDWPLIPELTRKIRKHAPQRTCLVTTADCEYAVYQLSQARPSTATSKAPSDLTPYTTLLLAAIDKERQYAEDAYQAKVCIGWIHWQLGELSLAASMPSSDLDDFSQLDGSAKDTTEWTKVCAVKASYIKGSSQQQCGAVAEALETFKSALPLADSKILGAKQNNELRLWLELYLTQYCMAAGRAIRLTTGPSLHFEALSAFRTWAMFWETQSRGLLGGRTMQAEVSRRQVWREYYSTLSFLLQRGLPFPSTFPTTARAEASPRLQQCTELKKVETIYESLLLDGLQFPKADEASEEVEEFVHVVLQNWRCIRNQRQEHDLGEGGAEAISRGVLDILYRAATRTFHSTAILRHLFTVHLSVSEFDLAFKAFDTYMELIKKAKARVGKTGKAEQNLDDDETVVKTASECIRALCRYGSEREAEKARDIARYIENWVEIQHSSEEGSIQGQLEVGVPHAATLIAPETLALTWRCIGLAHAQWARYTYNADARSDMQLQALKCFRRSLWPQYESSANVETVFALAILLAERREISAAIEVVKSGLLLETSKRTSWHSRTPRFTRERSLVPLWHLMSLLLSARQELSTAARFCEGAFEQFQEPTNLFGEGDLDKQHRSTNVAEKPTDRGLGILDHMDDSEKENMLQVKMTQLALIEILEGSDMAVNASDQLLSLYTRMFGDLRGADAAPESLTTAPPKSSAGTIKSFKGSIFGRHGRSFRHSDTNASIPSRVTTSYGKPPNNAAVGAPMIHITREKGFDSHQRPFTREGRDVGHQQLQKRAVSLSRTEMESHAARARSSSGGRLRRSSGDDSALQHAEQDKRNVFTGTGNEEVQDQWSNIVKDTSGSSSVPIARTHSSGTSTILVTEVPKNLQKRRRTAILIRVWLLINGFYRRARMYQDARGAIGEARTLLRLLDTNHVEDGRYTAKYEVRFTSVAELQSDIDSEAGLLALAEDAPYDALEHFESALSSQSDHPVAIVGLSNILLDMYTGELQPLPAMPGLAPPASTTIPVSLSTISTLTDTGTLSQPIHSDNPSFPTAYHGPLGVPSQKLSHSMRSRQPEASGSVLSKTQHRSNDCATALLDRLAARDRAFGLLSALTKLGTGWNCGEAWFALARAYEAGGQPARAREVLWWCVELEEGKAVRGWDVVASGGYVL